MSDFYDGKCLDCLDPLPQSASCGCKKNEASMTTPPDTTEAMQRRAFEAHVDEILWDESVSMQRFDDGTYQDERTQILWRIWQAAQAQQLPLLREVRDGLRYAYDSFHNHDENFPKCLVAIEMSASLAKLNAALGE